MDGYKLLQLVKMVLIGLTALVSFACLLIPFWFTYKVTVSLDAMKTLEQKTMHVGLFYMDQGTGLSMLDLTLVEKASNADTFPRLFRVAQIFYGLGVSGTFVCFVASFVYLCRRLKSATGEMCLAAGLFPTTMCLLLGVLLAGLHQPISDPDAFEGFPVPNYFMQTKAEVEQSFNIGYWIAVFSVILSVITLVIAWVQACALCKHVENVRYQMLHAPLTEDERGVGPGKTYQFQGSSGGGGGGFRYDGYDKAKEEVDF